LGFVYGIDFLLANLNIDGCALGQTIFEDVKYSIIDAQVNVLLTYNIVEEFLSVDFGPSLLINSNLRVRNDGQEDNIIRGFDSLRAEDIEDISGISPFLVLGLSGSFETIRFTIQYQYGFTNILENLNNQRLEEVDAGAVDFRRTLLSLQQKYYAIYNNSFFKAISNLYS